jgi:hypothetical protein
MRHEAEQIDHEPGDDLPPVRIDVERLAYALATETVQVPPGLTRDELLKFILAAGRPRQE